MAKIDKVKEWIGYLKVAFGLLIAVLVSLIAWLFENIEKSTDIKIIIVSIVAFIVSTGIFFINKSIIKKINSLEEL